MKEIENAIAAAQVLAFRLPMLWAMALSPTPARRAEAVKMLVEKHMALAEGMNAAALASFGDWMKGLGGHGLSFETSARVVDAALRPARRRVKANARRLRRRRRI